MRPALATDTLLGAAITGRVPRSESTPRREGDAGFAGLLDGARQQQGGRVYDGSAFDVPEAKSTPTAPRAGSAAEIERRQIDQRQQQARLDARRGNEAPESGREPAQRATEGRSATAIHKSRAPDAPSEPGRAPKETEAEGEAAPEQAAATADGGPGVVAMPAETEPSLALATTTQEWMARFASLSGAAAQSGAIGGDAALQRLPGTAAASEAGAPQAAISTAGLQEPAAQAAIVASVEEVRTEAAAPAVTASARTDTPLPVPGVQTTASPSTAAPTATTANLSVPLDAPDFSQALGWQLATLARDGVHEAQLQLNPVEMGPVQVQIVLDGGQAQIDFTAAQARTREVLEAGWPALAAAMHSAGFTLGGGGVFEQRSPEQDAKGQGGNARSRPGIDGTAAIAEPGVTRLAGSGPRGLLDLYA